MKRKVSKRFKKLLESSKDSKILEVGDAIKKIKANCTTKFIESIDASFKLNLKQKKEEINLRTSIKLPHGNGKKIRVAVLCEENKIKDAKEGGADSAGNDILIDDITSGKINFDKLVATPAMMPKMGKLGKILGPKGLMPNPKLGTVTNNVKSVTESLKTGLIEIKTDKDGNLAASIGKKNFNDINIKENYNALKEAILKERPANIKGNFILSAFLTSTMGTSYKLKLGK